MTAADRRRNHSVAGETGDGYRWIVLGVTSLGALTSRGGKQVDDEVVVSPAVAA